MAGTAEREIVGPQTPPCEIQLRQTSILPEPNECDATGVTSGQQTQNQHIQELQHTYNYNSCARTGFRSVAIENMNVTCLLFISVY